VRKSIGVKNHDLAGHGAVDRTVAKIQENYYFSKMRRYVRYHITCYPECLLYKIPRGKRPVELHPVTPGKRPFQILNVDHIGPFVPSSRGNFHVLVMIDNFTKFIKLYALCSQKHKHKIVFKMFVLEYGLTRRIISDRGTCFTSKSFHEYCVSNFINHLTIQLFLYVTRKLMDKLSAQMQLC